MVELPASPPASTSPPIYFKTFQQLNAHQSNAGSRTCLWFCITLITLMFMIMVITVIAKSAQRRVLHSDKIISSIDMEALQKANAELLKALSNIKRS